MPCPVQPTENKSFLSCNVTGPLFRLSSRGWCLLERLHYTSRVWENCRVLLLLHVYFFIAVVHAKRGDQFDRDSERLLYDYNHERGRYHHTRDS